MIDGDALGLLGLGVRAGSVLIGTGAVRAALQRDRVRAVVVAADRSSRTEDKVARLARAKEIPVVIGPRADVLGQRVGRRTVQALGITDRRLADGLLIKVAGRRSGGMSDDQDASP